MDVVGEVACRECPLSRTRKRCVELAREVDLGYGRELVVHHDARHVGRLKVLVLDAVGLERRDRDAGRHGEGVFVAHRADLLNVHEVRGLGSALVVERGELFHGELVTIRRVVRIEPRDATGDELGDLVVIDQLEERQTVGACNERDRADIVVVPHDKRLRLLVVAEAAVSDAEFRERVRRCDAHAVTHLGTDERRSDEADDRRLVGEHHVDPLEVRALSHDTVISGGHGLLLRETPLGAGDCVHCTRAKEARGTGIVQFEASTVRA